MNTKITAHSGCEHSSPNSIQHIKNALECNADFIEVDVRMHNGKFILSHDKPDCPDSLTLGDLLEMCKQSTIGFNLDLKEDDLEKRIVDYLCSMGMQNRVVLTGSVNPNFVASLRNHVRVSLNVEQIFPDIYKQKNLNFLQGSVLDELFAQLEQYQVDSLNLCYLFWNDSLHQAAIEHHVSLSLWTVDDAEQLERLLRTNPWNITTRFPKQALQLLQSI